MDDADEDESDGDGDIIPKPAPKDLTNIDNMMN